MFLINLVDSKLLVDTTDCEKNNLIYVKLKHLLVTTFAEKTHISPGDEKFVTITP